MCKQIQCMFFGLWRQHPRGPSLSWKNYCIFYPPFRLLRSPSASDCTLVSSTEANNQHRRDPEPSEAASERITRYLMSLNQAKSTVNDGAQLNSQTTVPPDGQPAKHSACHNPHLSWELDMDKDPPHGQMSLALSLCDVESVLSAGSTKSGSTFDKDHAAFRDGLSALDSSIANLLKTIDLDRRRSCI